MSDLGLIREGDSVIIRLPSGNCNMQSINGGKTIKLGKFGSFSADALIGKPYNVTYEIRSASVLEQVPVDTTLYSSTLDNEADDGNDNGSAEPDENASPAPGNGSSGGRRTNQSLVDDASHQQLSQSEIEELKQKAKQEGDSTGGQSIIQRIKESNTTFDQKTIFSQQKYIRRKEQKFLKRFTPIRTNIASICEAFYSNINPSKIKEIRTDTLSQLLALANIHSHSRVLVVDDTQGLIVSSIMARMSDSKYGANGGGSGVVVGLTNGESHNYDIVRYMNFTPSVMDTLYTISWAHAFGPLGEELDSAQSNEPQPPAEFKNDFERRDFERKRSSLARLRSARAQLRPYSFDALVVSTQNDVTSVLKRLTPLLGGSRPLVVYSQHKEVLVPVSTTLFHSGEYVMPQISQPWMREYQVLPSRTRPTMTGSGGGGHLLSATRVFTEADITALSAVPEATEIKMD